MLSICHISIALIIYTLKCAKYVVNYMVIIIIIFFHVLLRINVHTKHA